MQHTLAARAPKYHVTLDIDRKIRDFAVPEASLQPQGAANGLAQAMSQFMPKFYKLIGCVPSSRLSSDFFAHLCDDYSSDLCASDHVRQCH